MGSLVYRKGMPMKIAIVAGASSTLERELVRQLAKTERLNEIWIIAGRGGRSRRMNTRSSSLIVRVMPINLTGNTAAPRLRKYLEAYRPKVKVLINHPLVGKIAGYDGISSSMSALADEVNRRAAAQVTSSVLPYMAAGGRVVNIASTSDVQPMPNMAVGVPVKKMQMIYSRLVTEGLKQRHVSVTAVCPCWMLDEEWMGSLRPVTGEKKHFVLITPVSDVVRKVLRDSRRRHLVSVPDLVCGLRNEGDMTPGAGRAVRWLSWWKKL